MTNAAHICETCHTPIFDGEARYGARDYQHYDCAFPNGRQAMFSISEAIEKADAAIFAMTGKKPRKRPCRAGDGPTAKKAIVNVVSAFKHSHGWGIDPTTIRLWVQAPIYRGPRWDLAGWGGFAQHPEFANLKISFHSWASMTEVAKSKKVYIHDEGVSDWEVCP